MADAYTYFKYVIIVQLFFGFGYTMVTQFSPVDAGSMFADVANEITIDDVSSDIQENLEQQADIPLASGATLVGFSVNLIVSLILNSFLAFPLMIDLLIRGGFTFFNIDPFIQTTITTFVFAMATILYALAIISFLLNMRANAKLI